MTALFAVTSAIDSNLCRKFHYAKVLSPSSQRSAPIRFLQFNLLADGLSGLSPDLGSFSRISAEMINWEFRKVNLLLEILRYDPDIVTLQECDHFDDFFLPELSAKGYSGIFYPKPSSPCLHYSDRADGCAIFWKNSRISVLTSKVLQII